MRALPSDTACGGSPPTLTMAAAPSQSEDAEQMHVLVGAAGELTAEQRGGLLGRDLRMRGGSGQRRAGRRGERDDPVGQRRAKHGEQRERQKADLNGVHAHIVRTIVKIALGESALTWRFAPGPRGETIPQGDCLLSGNFGGLAFSRNPSTP
jgi:hypothetical protein